MISILEEGQKQGGDNVIENNPTDDGRGWLQNPNLLPKGVWGWVLESSLYKLMPTHPIPNKKGLYQGCHAPVSRI